MPALFSKGFRYATGKIVENIFYIKGRIRSIALTLAAGICATIGLGKRKDMRITE